jgi:hypothetical protein
MTSVGRKIYISMTLGSWFQGQVNGPSPSIRVLKTHSMHRTSASPLPSEAHLENQDGNIDNK